jgi:hypothetical protein
MMVIQIILRPTFSCIICEQNSEEIIWTYEKEEVIGWTKKIILQEN